MLCRPATSAREQFGKSRHSVLLILQPFKGSFMPPPFLPAPAMDPMDTTHVEDRVLAILGSLNDARANPQELHLHPSASLRGLVAEPVGAFIVEGYTCRTYLTQRSPPRPREAHRADPRTGTARRSSSPSSPADPHFVEPSSHVIEQYLDDAGQPNFVPPVNQRCEESDYVVRQAKDGFTACLNRDAHRSDRLPAMAVLNTFLGWDEIQGCSLHPRFYPIPLPFVGHGQLLRLIGDTTMALGVLHQHDIIHGDVVRNNLMLRADPPSFVLIDYRGSKETLWPAALGFGAKGHGGQRFRQPTEETDAPVMSTHGDFFRLARTVERDFYHPAVAGHRPGVYTGTARNRKRRQGGDGTGPWVLPRHVMQDLHQWQDASTWQIRPNPPNLFPPGTWKQTAHQPAIMLTARLWTPTGVACTDTTFFYNSLERKGNDRGHFVSEPISTVSLTESTGSWEGSAFSPRLMLICELKVKGNFYRPVAQEVSPWFAYSNDDGYLVKEAPPLPPMAPIASPPGPARDLHPLRGIWADPPAVSGDHLHASASAGDTAPEAGVHPAAVAATLQLRRAMGEPQGMSYAELMDGITVTQALLHNVQAVVTDPAPVDTAVTGPPQTNNAWSTS